MSYDFGETKMFQRRRNIEKRLSIFLIMVALIVGMAGCAGGGVEYDLTIASTAGGSVTTPGERTTMRTEYLTALITRTYDGN